MFGPIRQALTFMANDARVNALTRGYQGIEPRRFLRRLRAWFDLFIPWIVYLVFLNQAVAAKRFSPWFLFGSKQIPDGGTFRDGLLLALIGLATGITLTMPFALAIWAMRDAPAARLRANWNDYTMARLSAPRILWSAAGPRLLGALAPCLAHLAAFGTMFIIYGCFWRFEDTLMPLIYLGFGPPLAMIVLVLFDAAAWLNVTQRWIRLPIALGTAFIFNPLLYGAAMHFMGFAGNWMVHLAILFAVPAGFYFQFGAIGRAWRRSMQAVEP